MSGPFQTSETLDEAVNAHLDLIGEVKKLSSDVMLLRSGIAQNSADVMRALDAATTAAAKCDLVLKRLEDLRADISRMLRSNGHGE